MLDGRDARCDLSVTRLNNPLQPADVLGGRYQIVRVQRITGLSALYEARDLQAADTSARCAVKEEILEADPPGNLAYLVKDFEAKTKILRQLNHLSIPRILDGF